MVSPSKNITAVTGSAGLSISSILLILWLVGFGVFLFLSGLKILALHSTRQCSREIAWPGHFGVSKTIRLSKSSKVNTPMIVGFLSKHILVPNYWSDLSEGSKRSIIHHELAHLEQKDHWVIVLQVIGTMFNFFNPFVWILNYKINTLSELTCDERALDRSQIQPAFYVKSLVEVAEISAISRLMTMAPAFSESYYNLKSRIDYHLERGSEMKSEIRFKHVLALTVIGLFIIPLSCNLAQDSTDALSAPSGSNESVISEASEGPFAVYDVATRSEEPSPPADFTNVPFDQIPKIIGGYEALQQNLVYPEEAKKAGAEGIVTVRAFINENGKVEQTEVVQTTVFGGAPKAGLDEAAAEAVRKTTWEPARQGDKPVGIWYGAHVIFKLPTQ